MISPPQRYNLLIQRRQLATRLELWRGCFMRAALSVFYRVAALKVTERTVCDLSVSENTRTTKKRNLRVDILAVLERIRKTAVLDAVGKENYR
ncbi:hypothetical protein RB195_000111 [Necator americanus]|uniref:Uncharacterized protein n=1 Tax=Necator americanus TaxID=51031 RepID=A0ABR1D801_NECAM